MKKPEFGKLFSSESSDEASRVSNPRAQTDVSDYRSRNIRKSRFNKNEKVQLRINFPSNKDNADSSSSEESAGTSNQVEIDGAGKRSESEIPDGYISYNKTKIANIKKNTLIRYKTKTKDLTPPRYFKKLDQIANVIIVGNHPHNRRNYSENINDIEELFVPKADIGKDDTDELKDTMEITQENWKSLRRDMIISYQKTNKEMVYRSKFNTFTKGSDGSSRMSLTSERGFTYTANPSSIVKIYRHFTSHDKTLAYVLETLHKLELRIKALEKK